MSETIIAINNGLALISGPCCICESSMFYEKPVDDVGMKSSEICAGCSKHVAMEISYDTIFTDDYYTNKELFESYGITMEDLDDLEDLEDLEEDEY
jgi:hypothetical protein